MSLMDAYTWEPKETAGDCRRASALMLHHLDDDTDGVDAIVTEAAELDRFFPLLLAVLDQTLAIVPALDSEHGRKVLRRGTARLAHLEQDG